MPQTGLMDCIVLNRVIGTAESCHATTMGMMFFGFVPSPGTGLSPAQTIVVDYEYGILEIGDDTYDMAELVIDLPRLDKEVEDV